MQKSQPAARLSTDENKIYTEGYSAGFDAGRRASRDRGAQQNINRPNGQPFSSATGNRRSQLQGNKDMIGIRNADRTTVEPQPIQVKKPIKTGRLSDGFRTRKSFDGPILTRDVQSHQPIDEPTIKRGVQSRRSVDNPTLTHNIQSRKPFDEPILTRDVQSRQPIDEPTIKRGVQSRRSVDNPTLTRDVQSRKSFDNSTLIRDVQIHNQEHEMAGKTTNPETEVQLNTRGHY